MVDTVTPRPYGTVLERWIAWPSGTAPAHMRYTWTSQEDVNNFVQGRFTSATKTLEGDYWLVEEWRDYAWHHVGWRQADIPWPGPPTEPSYATEGAALAEMCRDRIERAARQLELAGGELSLAKRTMAMLSEMAARGEASANV